MLVRADGLRGGTLPHDTRRLDVRASSVSTLRASLAGELGWVRSRRITVEVASWHPPYPGWSGRLGPLPGVLRHEIRLPPGGPGRAQVSLLLAEPLPFQLVAGAVLRALTPTGRLPVPVSPDVAAYGGLLDWLPPWDNVAGLVGDSPDEEIIRPYDVMLADTDTDTDTTETVSLVARPWVLAGQVVVDATLTNPRGYLATHRVDAFVRIVGDQATVRAGTGTETMTADRAVAAVRALRSIRVEVEDRPAPAESALLLARLAMTGVAVHVPDPLPAAVADRLAGELRQIFAEPLPADEPALIEPEPGIDEAAADTSAIGWEVRSVRQRRAALRHHAAAWALPAAVAFPDPVRTPSVSAILVLTRPETAAEALAMLVGQSYPSLELVVARDRSVVDAQSIMAGIGHPVQLVDLPNRPWTDEDAYGLAASRARGSLIARFEEGARYGAEHIWDLVLAMHYSGAAVVGKACEFYLTGPDTVVRCRAAASESYVESLSDGPLLLSRADLATAGGWGPVAAGPGYLTHPFGFVRPAGAQLQGPAGSRSATDSRTLRLTAVTS